MRTTTRSDAGFTLVELLIVIAIIGTLAAITVPVYNQSRDFAANETTSGALKTVAARLQTQNLIWANEPHPAYGICQSSETWPFSPGSNVCSPGAWRLLNAEDPTSPPSPPVTGQLPQEVTVTGILDPAGRFCLDATSTAGGAPHYFAGAFATADPKALTEPAEGTCSDAGWEPQEVDWPTSTATSTTPAVDPGPTYTAHIQDSPPHRGALRILVDAEGGREYLIYVGGFEPVKKIASSSGNVGCWYPSNNEDPCSGGDADGDALPSGNYTISIRSRVADDGSGQPGPWSAATEQRPIVTP